ncbi:MAG: RecQ family ATP-dependent DNA helicase [Aureispira sp.]|nr:RecQ family ATP-dependent DNA helicase [Aureispira sp.]
MALTPQQALKKHWGYDNFRPLQLDIIQSVLDGIDTLALLPTGGGKSVCFQVPAICSEGIAIVVSPLIALMKDQVKNLTDRGIRAYAIYSGMNIKDIDRILDNCVHGQTKFLYLSPERLASEIAIERIKKMNVSLLAIDEAHCISQWGYDFRPSYLNIAEIREVLDPKVPVIALTATATTPVVVDIQEKLAFREQRKVFQKSFARDNLAYVVLQEENKRAKLLDILKKVKGSSVVYVLNRRETKEIALFLRKNRITADYYHAGLSNPKRSEIQEAWIKNKTRVIVATNAFGMGIDKPDVRSVVHITLPDSLEAYFQEAGRAGRDGKKAYGVLLYNQTDRDRLQKQLIQAFPPLKEIRQVYQALGSYYQLAIGSGFGHSFDFNLVDFSRKFNFEPIKAVHALKILVKEGILELSENVFFPSTLQIITKKEFLYDYMLRNPKMERLVKTILRSYQGAFNHDVNVKEERLAQFLKMSKFELVKSLEKLQRDQIIRYKPKKDMPQLTFLVERLNVQNVAIDKELYGFLKLRQEKRVEAALNYAESLQCRSQLLLDYFDEENPPVCGKCDVCLERHREVPTDEELKAMSTKIKQLLYRKALPLKEISSSFSPNQLKRVLYVISYLIDNDFVAQDSNKLLKWIAS